MAGPIGTRLRRLEKCLGVGGVPVVDDGGEDDQVSLATEAESREILNEMRRVWLAARLGREPTEEELAEEVAELEALLAEQDARQAEAGIKLRWSPDSLLILEKLREEAAAWRQARGRGAV